MHTYTATQWHKISLVCATPVARVIMHLLRVWYVCLPPGHWGQYDTLGAIRNRGVLEILNTVCCLVNLKRD